MSLGSVAAKLYVLGSGGARKSIASTAYDMMRLNLSLRFSVYNLVKSLTKSDVLATAAYRSRQQKKQKSDSANLIDSNDMKFKQYTLSAITNLSNKIDAVTNIAERNSEILSTIVDDLGYFKGKKKINVRNATSYYTGIRSNKDSIKGKIEQINKEIEQIRKMGAAAQPQKPSDASQALKGAADWIKKNPKVFAGVAGAGVAGALAAGVSTMSDDQKRKLYSNIALGIRGAKDLALEAVGFGADKLSQMSVMEIAGKAVKLATLDAYSRMARRASGQIGIDTSGLDPNDPAYAEKLQTLKELDEVMRYIDPAINAYVGYKVLRGTGLVGKSADLLSRGLTRVGKYAYTKYSAVQKTRLKTAMKVKRNAAFQQALDKWQKDRASKIESIKNRRGVGAREKKRQIKFIEKQFSANKPTRANMAVRATMRKVTITNKISKMIRGASKGSKIIARLIQGMRFLANNPVTRRLGAASILLNLGTLYNMSQAQSAYDSGKLSPKEYKKEMVAGYGELAQALGTSGLGMLTGFFVGGPVGALAGMGVGLLADVGLSTFTDSGNVMGEKLFNFFDRQPEMNYNDSTAKQERDDLAKQYAESKNDFAGVSGFDIDKYLELTRLRESSNNYKADNRVGFIGAYQMGSQLLETAGVLKEGMSKKYGSTGAAAAVYHPDAWVDGMSLESFLNNPQLQDLLAMNFTKYNYDALTQSGVIKTEMQPAQIAGALAAAHHGGIGGANRFYLEGQDTKDFAFNTSIGGTVSKMVADYSGMPAGSTVSALSAMASTETMDKFSSYVLKMLGEGGTSVAAPPEESAATAEPPPELTQAQAQSQAALVAITTMQNQLNVVSTEVIKLRQTVSQQQDFPHSENPDLENYA